MSLKISWLARVLCVAVACGSVVSVAGAAFEVAWSRQIGTNDEDRSYSVAVDVLGNAYISGVTKGSLGGTIAGEGDAFLFKFDADGNQLWSRQIGTSDYDSSMSVAVDAMCNAYISGYTKGSLGGTNAGSKDAFLSKFDADGNQLWSRQMGTSGSDSASSVAVDALGNAYISGNIMSVPGGNSIDEYDAFLSKFDPDGNELWSLQIGTSVYDGSRSVAVDASGNVYMTGDTRGNLGGTYAGDFDAFLFKFDSDGNELWSRQIGTNTIDVSLSVAVDALGNAYISGYTGGSLFETRAGRWDAFLSKFDSDGNQLWSRQIGTSEDDGSSSVAVDALGNVYISGYTRGSLCGTNAGSRDAFLYRFDTNGNHLCSRQIGTSESDTSWSVAVDASGNAYISGHTSGGFDGASAGGIDAFLIKFVVDDIPGDIDGDGDVDLDDFIILKRNYGSSAAGRGDGDFDGDGDVDLGDFIILKDNFGSVG